MTESGDMPGRILVVEDEPGIGEICVRVLAQLGYEVNLAGNGIIAEEKLRADKYDLIILDIRIPQRDGKQLYGYIGEKYPELQKGVIFTTGDVMGGDTQFFLEKSQRPVLLKPFSPDELESVVETTLMEIKSGD